MIEPIEKVIERCEYRLERALDCNVGDISRLITELKRSTPKNSCPTVPLWHGLGNGD